MTSIHDTTAVELLHSISLAIDGKPAATFKPQSAPAAQYRTYDDFKQDNNDSMKTPTRRTRAALVAFCLYSAGRISYQGVKAGNNWLVPDIWIVGALVKWGFASPDDALKEIVVTDKGWSLVKDTFDQMTFS